MLYTDATRLFAVVYGGVNLSDGGWRSYRMLDDLVPVSALDTLPTLLATTAPSVVTKLSAWGDNSTAPGATAIYFVYRRLSVVDTFSSTIWRFTSGTTQWATQSDGGTNLDEPPSTMIGGGERAFTPGDLDVLVVRREAAFGGDEVDFIAYAGGLNADKSVTLYLDRQGHPPLVEATLTEVSGGTAVLNGNTVENVQADGATVYTVLWNTQGDGVSAGERVQLMPRIVAP
jgi:hypothetical protein